MTNKPRLYIDDDFDYDEIIEGSEDDWWSEDDQMERERDLREGQEDNDADDLININIG